MKLILQSIILLCSLIGFSQSSNLKNDKAYKIHYDEFSNGEKTEAKISILFDNGLVILSKPESKIQHFTDFKSKANISSIQSDQKRYKFATAFTDLPKASFNNETERILKYKCKYAKYMYFSNTIEVWYTEKTEAKGSPYARFIPNENALVLKIVVNGNREIRANAIEPLKDYVSTSNSALDAEKVSEARFEELKINSRFKKLSVFDDEMVNFDPSIKTPEYKDLKANVSYHFSKGSVVMKKIKLSEELRKSEQVFAKLNCRSNGDAYDRTGSVFIIPTTEGLNMLDAFVYGLDTLPVFYDNKERAYQGFIKEGNYTPSIEVLRFFTSFGADHFNEKRAINNYDWAKDVVYKQEISSLMPIDAEEVWIGVFVGNYDKGGHKVSLELSFHPEFEARPAFDKFIQPLFSTINVMEMSGQNYGRLFDNDTLKVDFEITDDVENLQLLYTSTGHGGWGNGDEFNPKVNRIFIDGEEVFKIVPWCTDCATYRLSSPASGNFANGLSSSDLSRSNWCPAKVTPPYIVPLNELSKGKHTLEVVIDQGEDEGNSSNSWGISGVLTGTILK